MATYSTTKIKKKEKGGGGGGGQGPIVTLPFAAVSPSPFQ